MFQKTISFRTFFWSSMLIIGVFAFFPQLWMISTALKPESEMFTMSFFQHFTLENFEKILKNATFLNYIKNGFVVAIVSSVLSTFISALAGYSFSKYRYKGRKWIMGGIMISQAFPHGLLLLAIYPLMQKIGLIDNPISIILAYIALILPLGTWTLKSYFDQIPDSLIEAARVDGAGEMRTMFQVIFPLAVPGMMTIAIYSFVWAWNDLLYALTLISTTANRTLASGMVFTFTGEGGNDWIGMMSASVMASIPVAILFISLQKYYIAGMTSGSVKG